MISEKQVAIRERRLEMGLNNPKKDKWARRIRTVEKKSIIKSKEIKLLQNNPSKLLELPNNKIIKKERLWQKMIRISVNIIKSLLPIKKLYQ